MEAEEELHYLDKAEEELRERWKVPPDGFYKTNYDGAFLPETSQGGWGFIIRDHFGQVMAAGAGATDFLMNAQHAETVACMKAIEQAAALGMDRIVVETDAIDVAIALQDTTFDRSVLGTMFRAIR
ncbi:uncharacterized protein [Miscanthus floridulus]|uniref:uncharacterized protein n=1 Tax=Miscanthus floridulus TaxID=154761 RepID=UPI00345A8DB8